MKKFKYSKLKSFKHFITGKKPAPSGLIISFGNRGVGKSSNIAKDYYNWLKKDYKIYKNFYSNIKLNVDNPNYHFLDLTNYEFTDYIPKNDLTIKNKCFTIPKSLEDTPFKIENNSIIELDEIGVLYHSRDYKSTPMELIRFCKMLRKMGILFKCNSQAYDIDKQLRMSASDLRFMKKIFNVNISRKIRKNISINVDKDNNQSAENQIMDKLDFAPIFSKDAIHLTYIPFYADLFNSFE